MDQTIINWIMAGGGAAVGWILKIIWDAIRDMRQEIKINQERLQDDLKEIDAKMHTDFVRRDDFKEAIREIKDDMRAGFAKVDNTLGLLFKKLDGKADNGDTRQ